MRSRLKRPRLRAVVEELLNPEAQPAIDEDLMLRYHPSYYNAGAIEVSIQLWMYRMINSPRQLQRRWPCSGT